MRELGESHVQTADEVRIFDELRTPPQHLEWIGPGLHLHLHNALLDAT